MAMNIRTHRTQDRASSPGPVSRAVTPKDISPQDASWADRSERDFHAGDCVQRQDAWLDEAIELSFPASDPVAELPQVPAPVPTRDSQEALLDEAIALSFPASDPIAVSAVCARPASDA